MKTIKEIVKENKLKIKKPEYPITEYDKDGNIIHYKDSDGFEYWNKYDKNNNLIYHKDSDGDEYWNEYKNNNLIYHKTSGGYESWYEYKNNKVINHLVHYSNGKWTLNGKELIQGK